ncbi:unnamed protein product [Prunus brigantina]
MVQLFEIALVDEMDKAPDTLQPCSVDSLVDLLPSVTRSSCGNEFDNHTKCGPQEGVNCSGSGIPLDRLVITLAFECIQSDRRTNMFDEKMVGTNFCKRLSFSLRIYKATSKSLKGNLYIEYEASLVQAVGSFADVVPGLFRPVFEFVNSNVAIEGSFGTPILLLLEDFLELIWVKLRPKVGRSYSSCAKTTCSSELEILCAMKTKPFLETLSLKVVVELQMDTISQQLLLTLTLALSGFHIEILLMSFHLLSEEEKALHAKLIFSACRTIGGPTSVSNSTHCLAGFYWFEV